MRSRQPTIHRDENGWWFQIDAPTVDGKRRRIRRSGFRTATAAKVALADLRTMLDTTVPAHGRMTVADVTRAFIADGAHRSVNTTNQYQWSLGKVDAEFGTRIAADVTRDELAEWVTGLPLSARSKHTIIKHLRAAFARAVEDGLLAVNPAARLTLPTVDPTVKVWTPEQVQAWVGAADMILPCTGMARFAADTALRRGELLAVRWRDIDWMAGTVHVSAQLRVDSATGRAEVAVLKRARRHPIVSLHPGTMSVLRARRLEQTAQAEVMGRGWPEHDLVWCWPDGSPFDPNWWTRVTAKIADKAGLPKHGPHVLRHSFAAAAISLGVPIEVVSMRLGHASVRVTQDQYGQLLPAKDAAVAQAVGDVLLPAS